MAERRLFKEYKQYSQNPPHLQNPQIVSLEPVAGSEDVNIFEWTASISKPTRDDSPYYYNGKWKLGIRLTSKYPLAPPTIRFLTPINHPNINYETGEICLDILKQDNWSPAWNLEHLVGAILMLLDDPEPDSPLNIDSANLFRHDKLAFESLVQFTIWKANTFLSARPDPMRTGIKDDKVATSASSPGPATPVEVLDSTISQLELLKEQIKPPGYVDQPRPTRSKSSNLKVIHDVGEEVRKQFIAKVNEIGHTHSASSSGDFSDNDSDLEPVREQVAKNVTRQVERLCSQSASPDPQELDDSDEDEDVKRLRNEKNETVEKVRRQFIKQVDDKVTEVRKKQEEYQQARKNQN